ncbi:unnamed protein product [Mytilus coruscus]|uniref:DZIP3-like HEPN domain-containing protein n=1 Tax=Mytilus coruscus TaxID=42192 RepID=A0A6J8BER2_MYTCO|nr:unnamed protein product [Mytilus coruscus]
MSLSTLRNNFYRIATLIIDHGADVMRSLLDQFIQKKYISLKDFVSKNQHELYHQFTNDICCQCSKYYQRPYKQVISSWQMDTLFETNGSKFSCHKPISKCEYCCSTVKQNLQINNLDITLLKFFLVTYFEEEFWQNCLTDGLSFHDFLNSNKHDIFHLVQLNVPCCLCILNNPDYTVMVATGKERLNKVQWEAMFATTDQYSAHSETCVDDRNPCSVSATIGISLSSLNGRTRMIILSKFCIMMKHIDQLVHARNTVFAHAIKGELTDDNFKEFWEEIENSILYLAKITNKDLEIKQRILELREFSPKETMCLEMQCLALRQVQKDEQVIQESRNIQGTVESLAEKIDARLQEIQIQITNLKTHTVSTYIKESDLSGNSAWYSDRYEYAAKNGTSNGCSVEYKDESDDAHKNETKKGCSVGYKGATSLQACPANRKHVRGHTSASSSEKKSCVLVLSVMVVFSLSEVPRLYINSTIFVTFRTDLEMNENIAFDNIRTAIKTEEATTCPYFKGNDKLAEINITANDSCIVNDLTPTWVTKVENYILKRLLIDEEICHPDKLHQELMRAAKILYCSGHSVEYLSAFRLYPGCNYTNLLDLESSNIVLHVLGSTPYNEPLNYTLNIIWGHLDISLKHLKVFIEILKV